MVKFKYVKALGLKFLDVIDNVLNGVDLLSVLVWNRNAKLFLKFHDQLYSIQRICVEICCQTCIWSNLLFFYT